MLTPLLAAFPRTVGPLLELLDETLPPADGASALSAIMAHGPNEALTATENAQPAILLTSIAILRVLEEQYSLPVAAAAPGSSSGSSGGGGEGGGGGAGVGGSSKSETGTDAAGETDFFLGHSLGEFSALVAARVLNLADALRLVRRRGEVMCDCARRVSLPEMDGGPGETGMVALLVEPPFLAGLLRAVDAFVASETLPNDEFLAVANVNSASQIVLSGHLKAIAACIGHLRRFAGHDPRALRLNVSAPFHSMVMAPAVPVVERMLAAMPVNFARVGAGAGAGEGKGVGVVANVTARPYASADELRTLLARQCTATVRWAESVRYLDRDRGVSRWIGIGPGKVAINLVGREVRGGMASVIPVEGCDAHNIEAAVRRLQRTDDEGAEGQG